MKKGKFLILGLIALVLAGGLALASCRAGCPGNGDCKVENGKGSICSKGKDGGNNTCAATEAFGETLFGSSKKSGNCDC